MTKIRSYSELSQFNTFEERFNYLKLGGGVGQSTFGFDRYINQKFYTSRDWQDARNYVIIRDNSCDLGIPDYEIYSGLLIHHMNPMLADDIVHKESWILDPEFLITTTRDTHNAIHYGTNKNIPKVVRERSPRDTRLW
ncbi:MAG: hypothetical protein ABWY25_02160 [Paenisporosarcina sp.]